MVHRRGRPRAGKPEHRFLFFSDDAGSRSRTVPAAHPEGCRENWKSLASRAASASDARSSCCRACRCQITPRFAPRGDGTCENSDTVTGAGFFRGRLGGNVGGLPFWREHVIGLRPAAVVRVDTRRRGSSHPGQSHNGLASAPSPRQTWVVPPSDTRSMPVQ
jgi:hypothetical protein